MAIHHFKGVEGASHSVYTPKQAKAVKSILGQLGPFKMKSPMKCWKTHKRKPGTIKGAKGSCIPK